MSQGAFLPAMPSFSKAEGDSQTSATTLPAGEYGKQQDSDIESSQTAETTLSIGPVLDHAQTNNAPCALPTDAETGENGEMEPALMQPADGTDDDISRAQADQEAMPPPAAPASMLYTIEPSEAAREAEDRLDDPFVCARLVAVAVTLFRWGKGKESQALAQYTVDLIGQELWDKHLPVYMNAEADAALDAFAAQHLEEAVEEINKVDSASAGFLAVLKDLLF